LSQSDRISTTADVFCLLNTWLTGLTDRHRNAGKQRTDCSEPGQSTVSVHSSISTAWPADQTILTCSYINTPPLTWSDIFRNHNFWKWSVRLFLPVPLRFLLGPCPRGPHPGDGAA